MKFFLVDFDTKLCLKEEKTMKDDRVLMGKRKRIDLVAQDHKKEDLLDWVEFNKYLLSLHELYTTRTTGKIMAGLEVTKLKSGPLGGNMQVGAKIANGELIFLSFFGIRLSLSLMIRT